MTCEVDFKRHGDARYKVELFDLSASGCCLSPPVRLEAGDVVSLRFPGLAAVHGAVAWAQGWRAGIVFDRPFHPAVLADVADRLRQRPAA